MKPVPIPARDHALGFALRPGLARRSRRRLGGEKPRVRRAGDIAYGVTDTMTMSLACRPSLSVTVTMSW